MSTRAVYFVGTPLMLALLAISPAPAYPVDDVLGWQGTTWAMTESEVTKAMESGGFRLLPARMPFGAPFGHHVAFLTNTDIDGNRYDVAFQFSDRSGRLSAVLIGAVDDSREHAFMLHGSLLRTLSARYGPPADTDSRGTVSSATRWTFKTTTIALRLDTDPAARGRRLTQLSLAFSPTPGPDQRQAQDKLLGLALLRLLGEGWRP